MKASFELSTLLTTTWPGDANMGKFKDRWDHIVGYLRSPISDEDLEEILVSKLRTSEILKPHLEYYDRLPENHKDKSYTWVSQLINTLVDKERQRLNKVSLVLEASGKEQTPQTRTKALPVQLNQEPGSGDDAGSGTPLATNDPRKRKNGKKQQAGEASQQAGGGGDGSTHTTPRGTGTGGTRLKDLPDGSKCCIQHLWGRCKNPETCKFGPHLDKPTDGIKMHSLYIAMVKEHGEPTGPKPQAEVGAVSATKS